MKTTLLEQKWVWIVSFGFSAFLCGCASTLPPNAYSPAASVIVGLATAKMTNFKGSGVAHAYEWTYQSAWEALLRFASEQRSVGGGKVVAKSHKAGWIMTERKTGWIEAEHDVYFLDRLSESRVRIEVVSRTAAGAKHPADRKRAEDIHEKLANFLR